MSKFGDFLRKIGKKFKSPDNIREWREQKRLYRAHLEELGQDPATVRSGVRAWMEANQKPKKTKEEREKIYSDIPELLEDAYGFVKGNGANGTQSPTFTGQSTLPRKAGFNPLLLLLLIPLLIPNLLKKF
jgi:hypothetical protein